MRRMRIKNLIFIPAATLIAVFAVAAPAGAQLEVYGSDSGGNPRDLVFQRENTVSIRGTLDPPSGGETIEVRMIDPSQSCPAAADNSTPVLLKFTAWVSAASGGKVANVASNIPSNIRDARFCIYAYYELAGGGYGNPNTTYSHLVHFRDATSAVSRLEAVSSVSPGLSYVTMTGIAENHGLPSVSFVPIGSACPASFQGGGRSIVFLAPEGLNFTVYREFAVPTGFWRACGYVQSGGSAALAAQTIFSRAPKGGWKPKYSLKKGSIKKKGGKWTVGSVKCPGPCSIELVARRGSKVIGRGSVSGSGKLALAIAATGGGGKAKISIASSIDQSDASRTIKLKLR